MTTFKKGQIVIETRLNKRARVTALNGDWQVEIAYIDEHGNDLHPNAIAWLHPRNLELEQPAQDIPGFPPLQTLEFETAKLVPLESADEPCSSFPPPLQTEAFTVITVDEPDPLPTQTEEALLLTVSRQERTALDMVRVIAAASDGAVQLSEGVRKRTLQRLEERGWLILHNGCYRATEAGLAVLEQKEQSRRNLRNCQPAK